MLPCNPWRAGWQPVIVAHEWLVGDPGLPRGGEASNAVGVFVAQEIPLGGKLRAGRSRNDQVATDLRLYLRDHAREGNSQIVTQCEIRFAGLLMLAALENFEDKLIAFFTVLAHQCLDILDCRCFQRFETVTLVNLLYDTDDVRAFAHVSGQKIAHAASRLGLW